LAADYSGLAREIAFQKLVYAEETGAAVDIIRSTNGHRWSRSNLSLLAT
jgi:hypothetical protein